MRKQFSFVAWLLVALIVAAPVFAENAEGQEAGSEEEPFQIEFDAPEEEAGEALEDVRVETADTITYEEERTFADFMELFGDDPVRAFEPRRGRPPSEVTLVGMDEIGLIVEGPGGSEITYPMSDFDRVFHLRPDMDPIRIEEMIGEGEVGEAMEQVRRVVYPYLKFIELPENNVPTLHAGIVYLMEQLLRTSRVEEALEIARLIPERHLGSDRYGPAYREVILRLIRQEKHDEAVELADRFDMRPEQASEVVSTVMDVANVFRLAGFYSQADRFYQRIQRLDGLPEHREAILWHAYVLLAQERREAAKRALTTLGEVERGDPLFSLYRLVEGRMWMDADQYKEALLYLSEALVFGGLSHHWAPEVLFAAAYCYARLDEQEVAEELLDQLRFFFPDSMWAGRTILEI